MVQTLDADISAFFANSYEFGYVSGDVTLMEPGHSTGWRSLPFSVLVHHSGKKLKLGLEGSKTLDCEDGEGLCIAPGIQHAITADSGFAAISRWSHVNMSFLGTIDLCSICDVPILLPKDVAVKVGDFSVDLKRISREDASLTKTLRLQAKGRELAALLIDSGGIRPGKQRVIECIERLAPLLKYMQGNAAHTMSTNEMAQMVHLSVPRFHVVFKQTLGLAPGQFLQNLRMRRAQQLLLASDMPIADVACATGYDDPFHFTRLFTRLFGASPSKYRATVRAKLYESAEVPQGIG